MEFSLAAVVPSRARAGGSTRVAHGDFAARRLRWPGNAGLWAVALTGAVWLAMLAAHTSSPDAITRNLPGWTFAVAVGWLVLAAVLARRRTAWALWVPTLAVR